MERETKPNGEKKMNRTTFTIIGYDPSEKIQMPKGKVSIRFRYASATWVIYVSGRVFMSGFGSEAEAEDYLTRCEQA